MPYIHKAYEEPCRLAVNLAKNAGYAVFPCHDNKKPACPHGFKDASTDPATICNLWHRCPGPLIGVACMASGIDVLDIDVKHDAARAWWHKNCHLLPHTRAFRTRGGGVHLYLRHYPGITRSISKIAGGIDVCGEGGAVIYWFATGLECLDHSPVADWPDWLLRLLLPQPRATREYTPPRLYNPNAGIEGLLRFLEVARQGSRNASLFWTSCRFAERISAGEISEVEAEQLLIGSARAIGLPEPEARRTIASGLRRRVA